MVNIVESMRSVSLFAVFFLTIIKGDNSPTFSRDFAFAFINNFNDKYCQLLTIVSNANPQPTNVTITSIFSLFETINIIVAANSVEKIIITPMDIQARFGEYFNQSSALVIENKGIRIRSTLPIAVYAHTEITSGVSSDSLQIIPTNRLDTRYVAVGTILSIALPNVIMAVAYEDDTIISIGIEQVTLNALQVVTLAVTHTIISGIIVSANKPFAAFSSNMCGHVQTTDACDCAMTTLLPTTIWGTQFPLVPFAYVNNQQYQIVTDTNDTMLNVDGYEYQLNIGEYRTIVVNGSTMLTSNYPIQLVQMGQRADMYISYHLGDPFFVQIPSIDRWSNATLLVQPLGDYSYMNQSLMYYIRIYTSIGSVGRIQLDNVTISALIYHRIAQTDYYYYEQQMSNVTHCISAIDANVKYSVISYTYGADMGSGFSAIDY